MWNQHKPAYIVCINVSAEGGVPKYRVPTAEVTMNGIVGDTQQDRRNHGGPDRAVSLYSYELIQALQREGHPIDIGTTGENLTISGLAWETLQIGDQLIIGERLCIEITNYAAPCRTIAASFKDQDFARISHKTHPGWSRLYARVLMEGTIHEGDTVVWDVGAL